MLVIKEKEMESLGIYEVIIGDVLFFFVHMGLCGSPIVPRHIGGVLGKIIAFYFLNLKKFSGS